MNEFDLFVKHQLSAGGGSASGGRHYIRYADDFVILDSSHEALTSTLPSIEVFLWHHLKLTLHPNKIILKTFASGVDFLGWVNFSNHIVLRTATKKRMMRRIRANPSPATRESYLGLLQHGQTHQISQELENIYWLFAS